MIFDSSYKFSTIQPFCSLSSGKYIYSVNSMVVEGKKHLNPEKNGKKLNLVLIDAEFLIDQHIQNPLKSSIGKKFMAFFI